MSRSMKVGVLMGGTSAEREISLKSGSAVSAALKSLGHEVVDIDAGEGLCKQLLSARPEVAFIALHGGTGENGSVQGLLEVMGIPYTGSGVMASAMAMDKLVSKALFERAGLKVPAYQVVGSPEDEVSLSLPVVVKPSQEGSSIGVNIVQRKDELGKALAEALSFDGPALVEQYVKGKEVQIGILGERALGGVEVRPKKEFYDYEAKYTAGMTEYILPPELDESTYSRAMEAGLEAHRALGCRGGTRVDLIVEAGDIYALEVNTIPGMTETSLLPKIAALAGMDFRGLIREIVDDALKAYEIKGTRQ
jgi:D-alanine-D-alanine ligase